MTTQENALGGMGNGIPMPALLEAVDMIARHPHNVIELQMLDGNMNEGCKYTFSGKCVDHEMILDYSKSECIKHVLKFESTAFWIRDNDSI